MGFRMKKSFKVAPGVKVNLGRKSASVSLGPKGFKRTYSTTGRKTTSVSLGHGMSYTTSKSGNRKGTHTATRNTVVQKKQKDTSSYNIICLILGIIAFLTSFVYLGFFVAIPSIVLGIKYTIDHGKDKKVLIGCILSLVGIIIAFALA